VVRHVGPLASSGHFVADVLLNSAAGSAVRDATHSVATEHDVLLFLLLLLLLLLLHVCAAARPFVFPPSPPVPLSPYHVLMVPGSSLQTHTAPLSAPLSTALLSPAHACSRQAVTVVAAGFTMMMSTLLPWLAGLLWVALRAMDICCCMPTRHWMGHGVTMMLVMEAEQPELWFGCLDWLVIQWQAGSGVK
jgi:hypothetical protein